MIDKIIASKLHDRTQTRCVCLPEYEHARILLAIYLKTLDYPQTLEIALKRIYAQLSHAEIPGPVQIALFLSIFAVGAQHGITSDKMMLCSRYWRMMALYVLAEQSQASSLRSVEALETMSNILLLKQHQ